MERLEIVDPGGVDEDITSTTATDEIVDTGMSDAAAACKDEK